MILKNAARYAYLRVIGVAPMGSKIAIRGDALDRLTDKGIGALGDPSSALSVFDALVPEGCTVVEVNRGEIHFKYPGIEDTIYVAAPLFEG